jgi:hypothetical protein
VQVVDAAKGIEEVHTEITQVAKNLIHTVGDKPLGKLWTKES